MSCTAWGSCRNQANGRANERHGYDGHERGEGTQKQVVLQLLPNNAGGRDDPILSHKEPGIKRGLGVTRCLAHKFESIAVRIPSNRCLPRSGRTLSNGTRTPANQSSMCSPAPQ